MWLRGTGKRSGDRTAITHPPRPGYTNNSAWSRTVSRSPPHLCQAQNAQSPTRIIVDATTVSQSDALRLAGRCDCCSLTPPMRRLLFFVSDLPHGDQDQSGTFKVFVTAVNKALFFSNAGKQQRTRLNSPVSLRTPPRARTALFDSSAFLRLTAQTASGFPSLFD